MPRKSPTLDAPTLAALAVVEFAEGKRHYKTADLALQLLAAKAKVGRVLTVPDRASIVIETNDGVTRRLEIPEEYRGKKFRLSSKGYFFQVGQTARGVELVPVVG